MFIGIEVERHGQQGPRTICTANTLEECADEFMRHIAECYNVDIYDVEKDQDLNRVWLDLKAHRRGLVPHGEVHYMIVAMSAE